MRWDFIFKFRLNTGKKTTALLAHRDVFNFADDITAVAIANPADFREIQAVILLFQFATLRKTKALFQAFFLEFREVRTLLKEVFERTFKVF